MKQTTLCPECRVEHNEDDPHNPDSAYYQSQFKKQTGRWPTWADAIAHLPAERQEVVRHILRQNGVNV